MTSTVQAKIAEAGNHPSPMGVIVQPTMADRISCVLVRFMGFVGVQPRASSGG
jgi:hypothetical protein